MRTINDKLDDMLRACVLIWIHGELDTIPTVDLVHLTQKLLGNQRNVALRGALRT